MIRNYKNLLSGRTITMAAMMIVMALGMAAFNAFDAQAKGKGPDGNLFTFGTYNNYDLDIYYAFFNETECVLTVIVGNSGYSAIPYPTTLVVAQQGTTPIVQSIPALGPYATTVYDIAYPNPVPGEITIIADAYNSLAETNEENNEETVQSSGECNPAPGPTTISGIKFNDLNNNGIKDAGEPGLAGARIYLAPLFSSVSRSTITAADGSYSFEDVEPGTYTVREGAMLGWAQTYPTSNNGEYQIEVSGSPVNNIDFGNHDCP